MTRTIAILRVSPETYHEIEEKLSRVEGYKHAFRVHDGKPTLDMDGLALQGDLDVHKDYSAPKGFVVDGWRDRLRKLALLPRDDVRGAFCSPAMLDDVQAAMMKLDELEGRKTA
jgi:hypothetical protein